MKRYLSTIIFVFSLFALFGCTSEDKFEQASVIQASEKNFSTLMAHYFGLDYRVLRYEAASSGLVKAVLQKDGEDSERVVYILPNERDIIEGNLYTPNMDVTTLRNNSPQMATSIASKNTLEQAHKDSVKQQITKILTSGLPQDQIQLEVSNLFKQSTATGRAIQSEHEANVYRSIENSFAPQQSLVEEENPGFLPLPDGHKANVDIFDISKLPKESIPDHSTTSFDITKPVGIPKVTRKVEFQPPELPRANLGPDLEKVYLEVSKANSYVEEGSSDKVLYVFFDYECNACHQMKEKVDPFVANGDVTVRYLPIGMLNNESKLKAAFTLASPDNAARQKIKTALLPRKPTAKLIAEPPPKEYLDFGDKLMKFNMGQHVRTGKYVTPVLLYKTKDSNYIATPFGGKQNYHTAFKELISNISSDKS